MEMCYDGALVMPNKFVVMDAEEMTYVNGGAYKTYRNNAALIELTNMFASAVGWGSITLSLVKLCAASAATGFGLAVAVAASVEIGRASCRERV